MKVKPIKAAILIAIFILLIINDTSFVKKKETNILLLPSLPKPIAKEYVLITSAGQNTDVYIINDIANKLMIHNYFMPQAEESDLDAVSTIVFVVGYSELGEKLHGTSYENEKRRISELLTKARQENLSVITIFIGGKQQRGKQAEGLLRLVSLDTDYLIGTKEANSDGFLSELARNNKIPLTLINGVSDLSEPFASAFR
ncbi:MAG: hypothetical protein A2Y23_14555 [Clostridiales bacterium GWB2_37_7]|nr:MAG: hypothetical protein A2Y23_14555 [Clostridiales bacterium GWB2_37_7]